jgi:hypothetical protein
VGHSQKVGNHKALDSLINFRYQIECSRSWTSITYDLVPCALALICTVPSTQRRWSHILLRESIFYLIDGGWKARRKCNTAVVQRVAWALFTYMHETDIYWRRTAHRASATGQIQRRRAYIDRIDICRHLSNLQAISGHATGPQRLGRTLDQIPAKMANPRSSCTPRLISEKTVLVKPEHMQKLLWPIPTSYFGMCRVSSKCAQVSAKPRSHEQLLWPTQL